ncbi:MAG: hypothetical protein ABFR33_10075 [Verrucomicrobiota bacterium]
MLAILILAQLFPHIPPLQEKPVEPETADIPKAQTNLLAYECSSSNKSPVLVYEYPSLTDRLLLMANPEWLGKYQGAYTLENLQSKGGTPSLNVKSSWLVRNPNAPQIGITLRQNPATSEYDVGGGELFLPNRGVGVSYEKDEKTGETKTFLELKREF